jgi:hypothetical protein
LRRKPPITADTPVFDLTEFGRQLARERDDEPGDEMFEDDDALDGSYPDDVMADWDFKPIDIFDDPGRVLTPEEIEALYPGRFA